MTGAVVTAFEKHSQGILAAVITALLGWIGFTTWQTSIGIAELRIEVRNVSVNAARLNDLDARLREVERRP